MGKKLEILKQYDDNKRLYLSFLNEIEHQIRSILQTSQIACNDISSRIKDRGSLAEKIERKQKYADLADITDICGVRIITYYASDVDRIAEIIESEFDVDHENSIDKRESLEPDKFGYCSVHYVVKMGVHRLSLRECQAYKGLKCEIQIRSVLQHAWAEIEHDIGYKSEIAIPKEMRRSFSRIAGLLEIADIEFNNIRQTLREYKTDVQSQIQNNNLLDGEIDAVILDVLTESNTQIKQLNTHIHSLTGVPFDDSVDSFSHATIIKHLHWLGVKTVRQLHDVILNHTEEAKIIASEMLKNYDNKEKPKTIRKTIAFFYLCYALLLVNECTVERVYSYLSDMAIGLSKDRIQSAKEIYQIKESGKI